MQRSTINKDPSLVHRYRLYRRKAWALTKAQVLARDPICTVCRSTPSTTADHLRHTKCNSYFFNLDNLRGICTACNARTATWTRLGRQGAPPPNPRGGGSIANDDPRRDPLARQKEIFPSPGNRTHPAIAAMMARFGSERKNADE